MRRGPGGPSEMLVELITGARQLQDIEVSSKLFVDFGLSRLLL